MYQLQWRFCQTPASLVEHLAIHLRIRYADNQLHIRREDLAQPGSTGGIEA